MEVVKTIENQQTIGKKNLLYVTSRFPYPLEKGDKLRAYYQIKELSNTYNVHLICTSESKISQDDKAKLDLYCQSIHVFKLNKLLILVNLFTCLFGTKPFQVKYFYQGHIARKIDQLIQEIKPDHILCQLIRSSEYVKNYHHCSKTIDYMDTLSVGMLRRVKKQFSLKNILFKMEAERLKNYEIKIFNYFENQVIITQQDKDLIQHPDKNDIQVIPNGVSEIFFEALPEDKRFDIVFTGNMSYAPNVEAVHYLHSQIKSSQEGQKWKFVIAGAAPTRALQNLSQDDFQVTGWVDDIRTAYHSASVFVAPLFIGTGLQNKLLEAMACGIPCITTPLANNALLAQENKEILLAQTKEEFILKIQTLLEDPTRYQSIAEEGREFVRNKYSWSATNKKLIGILEK